MRGLFLSFCFFISVSICSFSQMIKVSSERDQDGNILINASNADVIPYTLIFDFSGLQNLSGGASTVISNPGISKVATLKRINANQGTNYSYTYSYVKGSIYAKSKIDPVYLIPVPAGVTVEAQAMKNLGEGINKDTGSTFTGVSFRFSEPSLIVAPRKGIVSSMDMSHNPENRNLAFSANENMIELYHEDGTFTRISVLRAGTEKVKIGQTVLPGQILAESGGENYENGRHVRVVNFRYEKENSGKFHSVIFPVKFALSEGTEMNFKGQKIEVSHPEEVIALELSKKELKSMLEGK